MDWRCVRCETINLDDSPCCEVCDLDKHESATAARTIIEKSKLVVAGDSIPAVLPSSPPLARSVLLPPGDHDSSPRSGGFRVIFVAAVVVVLVVSGIFFKSSPAPVGSAITQQIMPNTTSIPRTNPPNTYPPAGFVKDNPAFEVSSRDFRLEQWNNRNSGPLNASLYQTWLVPRTGKPVRLPEARLSTKEVANRDSGSVGYPSDFYFSPDAMYLFRDQKIFHGANAAYLYKHFAGLDYELFVPDLYVGASNFFTRRTGLKWEYSTGIVEFAGWEGDDSLMLTLRGYSEGRSAGIVGWRCIFSPSSGQFSVRAEWKTANENAIAQHSVLARPPGQESGIGEDSTRFNAPTGQAQAPPQVSWTYRARLSIRDHFSHAGRDLRTVPGIKASDILLQDRLNFHRYTNGEVGDEADSLFDKMSTSAYRGLFEDRPWEISPPGADLTILNGTPLVEVTIGPNGNAVRIIDTGSRGGPRVEAHPRQRLIYNGKVVPSNRPKAAPPQVTPHPQRHPIYIPGTNLQIPQIPMPP